MGSSTLINPSSQSEEFHQQCVSLHLSQNSQYLPKNFLSCFTSSSDSEWVIVVVVCRVGEDLWWIPEPLTCKFICHRSIVFCLLVWCLVGCPPLSGSNMTPLGLLPCVVLFCPGVGVLNHGEFSPCGLDFYLHL